MGDIFVGEWKTGTTKKSLFIGNYSFSNPFSANMFAYIRREYSNETAVSTVNLFEKNMGKSAPRRFYDMTEFDWGAIFRGNIRGGFDVQGTITSLAVEAGGYAVTQIRLSGTLPQYNPNSPESDPDPYTWYAIAYWGKFPTNGPAYKVLNTKSG